MLARPPRILLIKTVFPPCYVFPYPEFCSSTPFFLGRDFPQEFSPEVVLCRQQRGETSNTFCAQMTGTDPFPVSFTLRLILLNPPILSFFLRFPIMFFFPVGPRNGTSSPSLKDNTSHARCLFAFTSVSDLWDFCSSWESAFPFSKPFFSKPRYV